MDPSASRVQRNLNSIIMQQRQQAGKDLTVIEAASVIETLVHTLFQKGIPENAKNQCFEVLYLTVNKTQELRETAMRVLGMRQLRKLLDRYKATTAFVKFLDVVLEGKPTYDLTLSALTLPL